MNLTRPTREVCEQILDEDGFGSKLAMEKASVATHLNYLESQQKALIKDAADAAAAATTALAHTAAVAAASEALGGAGASVAAGGGGYSRQRDKC